MNESDLYAFISRQARQIIKVIRNGGSKGSGKSSIFSLFRVSFRLLAYARNSASLGLKCIYFWSLERSLRSGVAIECRPNQRESDARVIKSYVCYCTGSEWKADARTRPVLQITGTCRHSRNDVKFKKKPLHMNRRLFSILSDKINLWLKNTSSYYFYLFAV